MKLSLTLNRFLLKVPPKADLFILAVVAVVVGLINLWWIQIDQRPPHWDMARHLFNSQNYLGAFKAHEWQQFFTSYYYYPPLVYWLVIPWYLLLGNNMSVAVLANLPFILLLLISVYGIGRQLWGRLVGMTAAIVTISTPMLVSQFKEFQIDAPLTSLAAACLYALIRSREFSVAWWSSLVGVVVGLGLLCKWTFLLVIGLPLAYAAAIAMWQAIWQRKIKRLSGLVVAGLWAYAIPSAWYVMNNEQLRIDLLSNGVGAGIREGDPVVGSFDSNIWYLLNLVNVQLYLVLTLVLFAGMVVLLRNRREWRRSAYLILGIVGILVLFTALRNKDARYTLPMVPLVVLLGCGGLGYLKEKWRPLAAGALMAYSVLAFVIISFGWPWARENVTLPLGRDLIVIGDHGYIIGGPTKENWHQEEVFELMSKNPGPVMYSGIDTMWFNGWGLTYFSRLYKVPMTAEVKDARYMLRRVNGSPTDSTWRLLKSYELPDQTKLFLYERP